MANITCVYFERLLRKDIKGNLDGYYKVSYNMLASGFITLPNSVCHSFKYNHRWAINV